MKLGMQKQIGLDDQESVLKNLRVPITLEEFGGNREDFELAKKFESRRKKGRLTNCPNGGWKK